MKDVEKNFLFQVGSVGIILLGVSLLLPPKDTFRVPNSANLTPSASQLEVKSAVASQPVDGDLGNIVKGVSILLKGERQPASAD